MEDKIINMEMKIEENQNNNYINDIKNNAYNNNYKTFNKLIKLQKLIKKESALKELCKYKI
jgi:hypothetical protein